MAKAIVFGIVAVLLAVAYIHAAYTPILPKQIMLEHYGIYVPKSCMGELQKWTSGRSEFSANIENYLELKRKVEGCGGKMVLEGTAPAIGPNREKKYGNLDGNS